MAPYVWWFLIVGLAVGGAVVMVLSTDASRREEDVEADETDAEAGLIAAQLRDDGRPVDREVVAEVLRAHRDYRRVPPPDRLERWDGDGEAADAAMPVTVAAPGTLAAAAKPFPASALDADPDGEADDVGHEGGGGADEDLPPA